MAGLRDFLAGLNQTLPEGINTGLRMRQMQQSEEQAARSAKAYEDQNALNRERFEAGEAGKFITVGELKQQVQAAGVDLPPQFDQAFADPNQKIDKARAESVFKTLASAQELRTKQTAEKSKLTGQQQIKEDEQLTTLANSLNRLDNITKTLFETDPQGNLIRTRRELLLPGAQRGLLQIPGTDIGVDPEASRDVQREINFLVFDMLKAYQGARPSDRDLEIFTKTIKPLAVSFAKGEADKRFFDTLRGSLRFNIKLRQGLPVDLNDPDYQEFKKLGTIIQGLPLDKPLDPQIQQALSQGGGVVQNQVTAPTQPQQVDKRQLLLEKMRSFGQVK